MMMRTIGLVAALSFVLCCAPHPSAAQPSRVHRLGYLTSGDGIEDSFRQALRQLGYVEGQNLVIEGRFAQRRLDRLAELAAELVRLNVEVIVTISTPAALAAKKATTTTPIVMAGVSDPVALGLIASLARPGGNVTGVTNNPGPGWSGKLLQLLKDAAPKTSRVAVVWSSEIAPERLGFQELQRAAPALGLVVLSAEARDSAGFAETFATITRERADALYVLPSSLNYRHLKEIVGFATANRLPSMFGDREFVDAGGLLSYWTKWADLRRRAAVFVDRILKGARPADLPVEEPATFELVVNLKTAKALGLTIPQSVLVLADEVLQ